MKFNTNIGIVAALVLAVIAIAFQSNPFGLAAIVALIVTGIHHFTNPDNIVELPPVVEPVAPVEAKPARKKPAAKPAAKAPAKAKPAAAKAPAKKPAAKKPAAKSVAKKTRPNNWQ